MAVCEFILLFVIYSFLGWLYESTICSFLTEKRFINRGFLIGPYCPIYGVGATLCTAVFNEHNNTNVFIIFIVCAVGACVIEYITSYVAEKLFNTRWWDYSHLPLNVNGRICLYGAIIFGLAGTIIALIDPYVQKLFIYIDNKFINRIAVLIFLVMAADFAKTLSSWIKLSSSLKSIHESFSDRLEKTRENAYKKALLIEKKYKDGIVVHGKILNKHFSVPIGGGEMRFFKAFPSLKSKKYNEVVEKIQNEILKHKKGGKV